MKAVCMLTASITPNQIGSMPSLVALGPTSGTTMKAISKKSRKKDSTNTSRLTATRKPSTPPGSWLNKCSTQTSPSSPRNTSVKMVEPMRMKMTKVVSRVGGGKRKGGREGGEETRGGGR